MLYIDLPTHADIAALVAHRGAPSVSIYLRTTPLTQQAQADRIELKNLLKAAVAELEAGGTAKRAIWPIEQAVEAVIADDGFWATQANSLALFVTPERIRSFRLPNGLANLAEVSDRFHLKPLIRALGRRSHGERTGEGRSGEETSEHALLSRYARAVDQALRPVLAGDARPLIVAAAEPMASVFRAVSSYPHTAAEVIAGSADQTPDRALAEAARGVLDRLYAGEIEGLAALYATREAQGRATTDIAGAARAATFGAVDTLVFDMDSVVTGTVADADGAVGFSDAASADTYGVVDEIARRTLQSGGHVVAARRDDVPGRGDLAALLRYPV
jgi:hypothetical protein